MDDRGADETTPRRPIPPGVRWRLLIERIPAIAYVWGATEGQPGDLRTYTDLYVSPQIEWIFGIRAEDWLEQPTLWRDLIHPEDRDRVLAETERCVEKGSDFAMEYRVLAGDGRVVWVADSATVASCDAAGRATELHGVMVDVTARREAEEANRKSLEELGRAASERGKLLSALIAAQEEERRRIAGEIHDDTIQAIAATALRLGTIARANPDLLDDADFMRLEASVSDALGRLRHLVFSLHPPVLDTSGLEAALREYLGESTRTLGGPRYTLDVRVGEEPLPATRTILYRVAQEALTNVRKHSGASVVEISLTERDGGFLLVISDDGVGFDVRKAEDPRPGHLGLPSMRERTELAGGRLTISSARGDGTTLECWLPRSASPG